MWHVDRTGKGEGKSYMASIANARLYQVSFVLSFCGAGRVTAILSGNDGVQTRTNQ